jgi:hypothetical protein
MSIKKRVLQIVGITGAISLLMGSQALADVFVTADITKFKDITVTVDVFKQKEVFIFVTQTLFAEGAAEADAIANQLNENNVVTGVDGVRDNRASAFGIQKAADITNSVNGNQGVVGLNQDTSNMVNQANLVSLALTNTGNGTEEASLTNSQAEAEQINTFNRVTHFEVLDVDLTPDLTASIEGSINDNSGVVGVNQNAGNMNNQLNALALAVGLGSKFALSEASLGQFNTSQFVDEIETVKSNLILASVNGNSGIVGVNQSTGNMNNQASLVSMSVLTSSVAITLPTP